MFNTEPMTQFDLSTLSRTEADELTTVMRKYQRSLYKETSPGKYSPDLSNFANYNEWDLQRGWCAGILDKLFDINASGNTTFPVCDADYTATIQKAYNPK